MEGTEYRASYPARERRGGSIVGPALLIVIGVLFLGQTLGWFPSTIWSTLLNYWPIVLIAIGAELVLGRGSWIGALVLALVVLGIVAAVAFAVSFPISAAPWPLTGNTTVQVGPFLPVETMQMVEEVDQAKRGNYQLEFGAGTLSVSALPSGSANLIQATLERDANATIDKSVTRRGDLAQVTIQGRNADSTRFGGKVGRTRMTVQLSPSTPGELRVNGGAGDLDLDLSAVPLTYLELNAGVGGSKVVLPQAAGRTSATVNVGVGGVDITVPEGVAAQIRVDKGLGGVDVDQGRFPRASGDTYRSANYDSAANRVDLYVSGGVGGLTVK